MKKYLLAGIAIAFSGAAFAQDAQREPATAGIAMAFVKTDSGSGSALDRLVGAIAAKQTAEAGHTKATTAAEAAKAELEPVAEMLKGLETALAALPRPSGRSMGTRGTIESLRTELSSAVSDTRKRAEPLAAASDKAGKAVKVTGLALQQAECELQDATGAWQTSVMAPATAQVVEMAGSIAKLTAERDAAMSAKADADAQRAEFCARNPTVSLCVSKVSQTGG